MFDGGAVDRRRREADRSCSAVTGRNCGVHLWVIWQLLTVFSNSDLTLLAGHMSYSLLWKLFGTDPT